MSDTPAKTQELFEQPLDQEDQDAIILDARCGDLESLKEIFETMVHPKLLLTCFQSYTKSTPLHMASANGHLDVVKYLIKLAEENITEDKEEKLTQWVNQKNESGNTALHWACLNGQLDIVKYLCDEYNADPFIKNNVDHDAIFEAENSGKEEIETYFLKKYDVEPEENEEDTKEETPEQEQKEKTGDILDSVQVTAGTEIENVTKEAHEAMAELKL